MSQAVTLITERVRERVRRDGADLMGVGVAEGYIRDEVRRYSERALGGSLPLLTDETRAASQVLATLTGFGALQPFFDDASIEEIWINSATPANYCDARLSIVNNSSVAPKTSPISAAAALLVRSSAFGHR